MKVKFLIGVIALVLYGKAQAQDELLKQLTKTEADELNIGDTVPDLEFNNMYNYPGGKAKLSDFKGKLVILDFWNLGCSPCIKAFPKMQQLQDEFGDKIQILLVNVNDNKETLDRWGFPDKAKSPFIRETRLPFAMLHAGTPVEYLFPASSLPYHVWINGSGKIIATTAGVGTTAAQIEKYLSGKPINIRVQPTLFDIGLSTEDKSGYSSILNPQAQIVFDNLLYSSVIVRNISAKKFSGSLYDSLTRKMNGIRISGDRKYLLRTTFSEPWLMDQPARVVLEVDDPENYLQPPMKEEEKRAQWDWDNIFSYEMRLPASRLSDDQFRNAQLIRKIMRQDLERAFGVKAVIEKRTVNCLVLVRTSDKERLMTEGGKMTRDRPREGGLVLKNAAFNFLKSDISRAARDKLLPFFDETGFSDNKKIDIAIHCPFNDLEQLNKELKKYDLDIREEQRTLEVLVIKKDDSL